MNDPGRRPFPDQAPRRLRRAEAVLALRSARILVVLERAIDTHNHAAVMRTAEAFGVQHVWTVESAPGLRRPTNQVTRGAWRWLSVRRFSEPEACLEALREDGREVWATDLAAGAELLEPGSIAVPRRLAIVFGREADGVSEVLLRGADRRVALPMRGFVGSFNVSVAAGLVLQRLFDACPEAHGDLTAAERRVVREAWHARLAGSRQGAAALHGWLESPPEPQCDVRPPENTRLPRTHKRDFPRFFQRPIPNAAELRGDAD